MKDMKKFKDKYADDYDELDAVPKHVKKKKRHVPDDDPGKDRRINLGITIILGKNK
jgi:hypothetical protein